MTVAPASPRAAAIPRPAPRVAPATTAIRPRKASGSTLQLLMLALMEPLVLQASGRILAPPNYWISNLLAVTQIESLLNFDHSRLIAQNSARGSGSSVP